MVEPSSISLTSVTPPRVSEWRRIVRVMRGRFVNILGIAIIGIFLICTIFAPFLAPFPPNDLDLMASLAHPSLTHPLGTDDLGRDTLSRVIYGSRISLLVGLISISISFVIGLILGLTAGYFGGWLGAVIMRLIDAIMAIPPLILTLAIATVLGGGLVSVFIAVGITFVPTYARLTFGQILSLKESDYITAAKSMGARPVRIMALHLLPNSFPVLLVTMTMNLGTAILVEASLSFLGIGIHPPTATWGSMVNEGYRYLISNAELSFVPGLAIMLVVLGFNVVGDGLRDALDPRLRGTL
jgi:peptide/nickel transport system permease protein